MRKYLVFTIVGASFLMALLSPLYAEQRTLKYVIDGDTVVFNGSKCRLAYIDTPESKRNRKATRDVAKCNNVSMDDIITSGRYAKRYLSSIIQKGSSYRVKVIDVDRYKRDVCVIYDHNGDSINEKIVRNGFAVPYWKYIRSSSVKRQMVNDIRSADNGNKGIWRTHRNVMECMN